MSNNTVTFKVAGNDILAFMDKTKQKADELTGGMISNARKQADAAKDQLKSLEDQIKALERKSKIEQESARQVAINARNAKKGSNQTDYESRVGSLEDDFHNKKINRNTRDKEINRAESALEEKNSIADKDLRDELKSIREQERQAMLQTKLMRDNIETIKTTSNAEVIQMRKGDDGILDELDKNATPMQQMARDVAAEKYQSEQEKGKKEGGEKDKHESTFGALLKAMALEKSLGLVSGMPNAKNELDFVKPVMSMIGMGIGGLMGSLLDLANVKILGTGLGNSNFGAIGAQLGEKAGEFFGNSLERSYRGRDELTTRNFRLQALTGQDMQVDAIHGANGLGGTGMSRVMSDLKEYGLDMKTTSDLQFKIASAKGTGSALGRDSENVMALQQALSVGQETSMSLMELMRSSKADSRDIVKLVGGVLQAGQGNIFKGDRTFLNEFLQKNFAGLQKQLLNTTEHVGSASTFDILKRFNNLGGAFDARDPRSLGLINQVNSSLVNPGSDSLKAYSFMALRKSNPGMGMADLMMEREKGLSSPAYLKSMLGMVDQLGGDDQMKRMNIAGMFGVNQAAAKRIFEGRQGLMNGSISAGELVGSGEFGEEGLRQTGRAQTSYYSKSTAEIEDAFIKNVATAIGTVGDKMKVLFGDMIGQLKDYISGQFSASTPTVSAQTIVPNRISTPKQIREANPVDYSRRMGANY